MDGLKRLNSLPEPEARAELERCCGSSRWAAEMARRRPFQTESALFAAADSAWNALHSADWLEAFSHHPMIGDKAALRAKFPTRDWAKGEQAGAALADEKTLDELAAGNRRYKDKFGFIFIVCATGKSAGEMLALLNARLPNPPDKELPIASAEQAKITRLRLEKLLQS